MPYLSEHSQFTGGGDGEESLQKCWEVHADTEDQATQAELSPAPPGQNHRDPQPEQHQRQLLPQAPGRGVPHDPGQTVW